MAPLHPLVHSPNYDRGNRTTLPSSSYTSSPNRVPESFPKGLLGYLFHDGEGTPSVAVSLIKVESKTKYVRNTNRCYELQYAGASASYRSLQGNLLSPNTYSDQANIMSTGLVNLSIKSEPEIDGASCSLLKSLRDQDARFVIKAEPDQNSELDLKPAVFDQRVSDQAAATIPGICSTEKPQDDTFPAIDDPQPCRDTCDADLSDRYQVRAKMPSTGSGSNVEPQGIVSTQSASANVIRTSLLKKRRVAPYSKLALYSQLRRLLRADVPQLPSHAAAHPTLNPQPPDDGGHEFPHHDGHPQSSRLYKSLYGLAQCLRSQVETSASSLNPNDASNTPVFNQAGVNGDGASGPSSTEMPNNYVNDSGRHLNLGPHETTNDVGLETLDPHSLYQLGMLCLTLALELAMGATSVGTSQHHIPDLVSTLSGLPVPLPMQLNEPDTHGHFPSVHPARTPGTQTHHQSYFSESYQDSAEQSEQRSAGVNASQLQAGEGVSSFLSSAMLLFSNSSISGAYRHYVWRGKPYCPSRRLRTRIPQ
ncbi:hypothetical protein OPQ81_000339 [Rhizoctonia solani]|nr:hypothetical protein OPQ81_000339 [Rhizoctonia solani]